MYALTLLLLAALPADAEKNDLDKLQGVWKPTEMEFRGAPVTSGQTGNPPPYVLVVAGDRYAFAGLGGTLKLGPMGAVDLVVTEGPTKGVTRLAVYELAEDTLKLALANRSRGEQLARPTALKTDPDSRHTFYTFTREKATKEEAEKKLKELTAAANQPARGFAGGGGPPGDPTMTLLRQVIERLDRIEKRLDAIEKQGQEKK